MGKLVSFQNQFSDRERVIDIVDMYNVWSKDRKYRTCPFYKMSNSIRNGKRGLTPFLNEIANTTISPEEFSEVLSAVDNSIFLQTIIKVDNLFFWLFKKQDSGYNYDKVAEERYKNKDFVKDGKFACLSGEEAKKSIKTDFEGWDVVNPAE